MGQKWQKKVTKNVIELKIWIYFKTTSNGLFETLNSSEKSFDFGWDRTRVPMLASSQR